MREDPDFLINLAVERIEFQLREQPEFQPTFLFRNDCQCGLTYPEQEGGAGDDFKDFMSAIRLLNYARNVIEGVLVGALQSTGDKSFVPFTDECIIVVHESRTRRKTLLMPVYRTANGDYDHLGSPIIPKICLGLKISFR